MTSRPGTLLTSQLNNLIIRDMSSEGEGEVKGPLLCFTDKTSTLRLCGRLERSVGMAIVQLLNPVA